MSQRLEQGAIEETLDHFPLLLPKEEKQMQRIPTLYLVQPVHGAGLTERTSNQPGLLDWQILEERMQCFGILPGHWHVHEGWLHVRWAEQDFRVAPFGRVVSCSYENLGTLLDEALQQRIRQEREILTHLVLRGLSATRREEQQACLKEMATLLGIMEQQHLYAERIASVALGGVQ